LPQQELAQVFPQTFKYFLFPAPAANQTFPKLEIADKSHRAADRALEKFLSGNQIELSAGQLVPAMQAANQTFPKLEIADQSQSH